MKSLCWGVELNEIQRNKKILNYRCNEEPLSGVELNEIQRNKKTLNNRCIQKMQQRKGA